MTQSTISEAASLVDRFVADHHAAAIPALLAACVQWAVERGGAEVIKGSLRNAIKLADDLAREHRSALS